MKKVLLTAVMILSLAGSARITPIRPTHNQPRPSTGSGGRVPGMVLDLNTGELKSRDLNGRLRRLEEDIEDVEKKMRNADPGSRRALNLQHEREKLALEFIHEAHRYFLEYGWNKTDRRSRKMRLMLDNEAAVLKGTVEKDKRFFGAEYLNDSRGMLRNIRNGRLKYRERAPINDSMLLKDIHKIQKKALEDIHREQQKKFRPQK
ncbi:MAG: hypothetical protein E7057_05830 [Lentisphaerae bacterium]|nr:hypothetical protein [Lentisphaerota bacterium]